MTLGSPRCRLDFSADDAERTLDFLTLDTAREFFTRLLLGHNVLNERREIEALIRYRYRGHSQGALISALHKVFEAVDQSPLVLGDAAFPLPSAKHPDVGTETYG